MPLHIDISRYDDILCNPESRLVWNALHHGFTPLEALVLIARNAKGALAEHTRITVCDEDTGEQVSRDDLARRAYAHARREGSSRPRFGDWFVGALEEILLPWDDAAPMTAPPDSYWANAACWTRRTLGHTDDWLVEHVDRHFATSLRTELARHDTAVETGSPLCIRCTTRRRTTH